MRGERPGQMVREEPRVLLVARDRARRQAVGLGDGDRPDQVAQVVLGATKCLARASSSSGWTGGLARLMSSGGSTRPLPKSWAQTQLAIARAKYGLSAAVIQSARALRGSSLAATFTALPSRSVRLDRLLGPQVDDFPVGIDRDRRAAHHRPAAAAALDLGEERGQAVIGVLRPDVERVVVALGASQPQAQEPLGRQLGLDVGLEGVHRVVDRPAVLEVGGSPTAVSSVRTTSSHGRFLLRHVSIQAW